MGLQIQPQLQTFGQLISGRLFNIPNYQRSYSWGTSQRRALFADINRTWEAGEDRTHFMATVVGLRRGTERIVVDDYAKIDIVDGQQRVTTLVLLLKSIAKILAPNEERIKRDIEEALVKPDSASLLLLQTNHDTSHYFADYLRNGTSEHSSSAKTIADRELLKAIEECEEFAREWQQQGRLNDLVALLRNRLEFIFHETPDEALVYTVFEVLNSRGLPVSWVDRLKSMLMATVFETASGNQDALLNDVHSVWSDIYRCVGLRQGLSNEALRFAATLRETSRPNRPLSPQASVNTLHGQATGPAEVINTTTYLKSVTEAVDALHEDHRRNAVTRIGQARLLATAIHLQQNLTAGEKEQILRLWESVSFRIYGMFRKDARTAVGDYVRLSWRIANENLSYADIVSGLSRIGRDYPADEAAKSLSRKDFYPDRTEETRYFLARYEEFLTQKAGQKFDNEQWNHIWAASAADSIEHILPQSSGDEDYIHRIGNLVLLPPKLNSQLRDKAPGEKSDDYRKTGLLQAEEVTLQLHNWNRAAIERREKALLDWAVQEWADPA